SVTQDVQAGLDFVNEVKAKTGLNTVIYTGYYFFGSLGNPSQFAPYPLFIADYTSGCTLVPSPWTNWTFWQYSSSGSVPGVGGSCDVDEFNGTLAQLGSLNDQPPQGYLDSVDCTDVAGWSYDPDQPSTALNVDIYFGGPAGSGAPGIRTLANVNRPDLCTAIGSCDHGFVQPTPRALMDGQTHQVYPYGIDPAGSGDNPLLSTAPKPLVCDPSESGVRRHVTDPTSYAAWGFSAFQDVRTVSDATLTAWPEAGPWPGTPTLIQGTGTPEVWLVDGPFRRHVVSPASATEWHFNLATMVQQEPSAQVLAMPQGPDLRERPTLVQGSGPEVDELDDPLPVLDAGPPPVVDAGPLPATDAGPSPADAGVGADGGRSGSDAGISIGSGADAGTGVDGGVQPIRLGGGCGCSAGPDALSLLGLLLGAVALAHRRRRPAW
ncbi:MAG: glycoside hydrolase family 25 protein, partial [Deltaproteobacteria bacterium]